MLKMFFFLKIFLSKLTIQIFLTYQTPYFDNVERTTTHFFVLLKVCISFIYFQASIIIIDDEVSEDANMDAERYDQCFL